MRALERGLLSLKLSQHGSCEAPASQVVSAEREGASRPNKEADGCVQGTEAKAPARLQAATAHEETLTEEELEDVAAQGLAPEAAKLLAMPLSRYPKTSQGTNAFKRDMRLVLREQLIQEGRKRSVSPPGALL